MKKLSDSLGCIKIRKIREIKTEYHNNEVGLSASGESSDKAEDQFFICNLLGKSKMNWRKIL